MSIYNIMPYIWGAFWAYWLVAGVKTRSEIKKEKIGESSFYRTAHLTIETSSILIVIIRFDKIFIWKNLMPLNNMIDFIGLIILIVGLLFSVWSRLILGRNWSGAIQKVEKQQLTQNGPYKYIRNPIYTGIILGLIGSAIINRNIVSILAVFIIATLYIIKIRKEQRFLIMEFGEQYIRYIKKSWKLFPFLY